MTSATARLWDMRDRAVPSVAGAMALTGLPMAQLRDAARISLAASPECRTLLDELPVGIRRIPMALTTTLETCVHSVRGQVVWSETITARANSFGNDDIFVCTTSARTFDDPLNRALVWVLSEVALAARAVRGPVGELMEPAARNEIDDRAAAARAWRHHRRLAGVRAAPLHSRDLTRVRHGRHRSAADAMLEACNRAHEPFSGDDVDGLTEAAAREQHTRMAEILESAKQRTTDRMALVLQDGALRCGGLAYRHPAARGSAPAGLTFEGRPLDQRSTRSSTPSS